MTKKKSIKKQIRGAKKEYILWIVIIILTALLVSTIWYIAKTSSISTNKVSNLPTALTPAEEERQQEFVNEVEERRYRYPVIDVKENRVYIPEARMYVPLSEDSRDLRYQWLGDRIWLSVSIAVGRQTGNEDASCDKVVIVTESEVHARGYIAEGTIKAKDGSIRHIFRHPPCKLYGDEFSKRLADVAKQIQYY